MERGGGGAYKHLAQYIMGMYICVYISIRNILETAALQPQLIPHRNLSTMHTQVQKPQPLRQEQQF